MPSNCLFISLPFFIHNERTNFGILLQNVELYEKFFILSSSIKEDRCIFFIPSSTEVGTGGGSDVDVGNGNGDDVGDDDGDGGAIGCDNDAS